MLVSRRVGDVHSSLRQKKTKKKTRRRRRTSILDEIFCPVRNSTNIHKSMSFCCRQETENCFMSEVNTDLPSQSEKRVGHQKTKKLDKVRNGNRALEKMSDSFYWFLMGEGCQLLRKVHLKILFGTTSHLEKLSSLKLTAFRPLRLDGWNTIKGILATPPQSYPPPRIRPY